MMKTFLRMRSRFLIARENLTRATSANHSPLKPTRSFSVEEGRERVIGAINRMKAR